MLLLERKIDETITLELPDGGVITVLVQKIRGGIVTLGFNAPRNIVLLRDDAHNRTASQRFEVSSGTSS